MEETEREIEIKRYHPLLARSERLKGVITTGRYTNPGLPLPLPTGGSLVERRRGPRLYPIQQF